MPMPPDLTWTTLSAALTGLLWVPVVLDRLAERGVWPALRHPNPDTRARADWAWRLAAAHRNAVENLVVFAPLALAVVVAGLASPLTATACVVYFVARLCHAIVYTLGIPVARTLAFAVGFGCQAVLAVRLLGLG